MGVDRCETHVLDLESPECSVGATRLETQSRGLVLPVGSVGVSRFETYGLGLESQECSVGVSRFETQVLGLESQACSVGGARFETQVRGLTLQEELLAAKADAHVKQCTSTHSAWEKAQAQVWNRMGELLVEMADVSWNGTTLFTVRPSAHV